VSDDERPESAFGHPDAVVQRWAVPDDADGERADVYLARKVRRLSRTRARAIIAKGDFRASDGPLKPSTRLQRGAGVELWRFAPDEDDDEAPAPIVLFEDEDLLVIDKPGDLAVHPSARYLRRTLTAWLRARAGVERPARPCHRLDRETSGALVCAHSRRAESSVKTAFAQGGVQKVYLAVVRGRVESALTIDRPLALQGERGLVRIRMIGDDNGQPAQTAIEPLAYDDGVDRTLVRCRPRTGRQHQIRAHLAIAGWPIAGDKLYAMGDAWFDAFTRGEPQEEQPEHVRHALHAHRIAFELDGRPLAYEAPFPDDLRRLLPSVDVDAEELRS
jgi:23S rRNA pseudouridine1911/1915/1917 synthase